MPSKLFTLRSTAWVSKTQLRTKLALLPSGVQPALSRTEPAEVWPSTTSGGTEFQLPSTALKEK